MTEVNKTIDLRLCPNCDADAVSESLVTSTFDYGAGLSVPLTVTEPVMSCSACGEKWTDWRGEEAREAAVDRYRFVMAAPIQAKLDAAEKRLRGYEAWERSVNEALNSGDGSYRP